jgi:hypothetical protein
MHLAEKALHEAEVHFLSLKLLDAVVHLARNQGERHNARDVHLRAENVHVEAQLLPNCLDVLKTFLVVGASAADPDLDLVLVQEGSDFAEGANNTFESAGNLCAY